MSPAVMAVPHWVCAVAAISLTTELLPVPVSEAMYTFPLASTARALGWLSSAEVNAGGRPKTPH